MGEYTYDEDIDALATHLHEVRQNEGNWWCDPDSAKDWSRALTALVAERDALKHRVAELEAALKPSDRDLRERRYTMQRWMNHVTGMLCQSMTHSHDAKQELVTRCDTAIAAMWKGESDGK